MAKGGLRSTSWKSSEEARAARLGQGRLQRARAAGLPALSAKEYRCRLRAMVPEALDALAEALKDPKDRLAAVKLILDHAFLPSVMEQLEGDERSQRFTDPLGFCFPKLDDSDEAEQPDLEEADA
ncbi:MAG: hypothetical protein ACREFZ_00870 [Acetobacteraceae bacterium]